MSLWNWGRSCPPLTRHKYFHISLNVFFFISLSISFSFCLSLSSPKTFACPCVSFSSPVRDTPPFSKAVHYLSPLLKSYFTALFIKLLLNGLECHRLRRLSGHWVQLGSITVQDPQDPRLQHRRGPGSQPFEMKVK